MSKLEQITAFLDIVHENSFAAAARKQSISTAAISRQIARLEEDLGAQLLHRTTRQISLTEIGAQYYQHCKNALEELTKAEEIITHSQDEPTGTLNITSNRYFANQYLIPYLPEFMSRYPNLRINLELAERFPDFKEENIDILFGTSMDGPPELIRKRITTTRYILCASPAYLKKYGIPKNPSELSHHHYITHSMRKPNNVIAFKNNKEVYIDPMLSLNDCHAMRECAILGMGIVMLHNYIVTDAIKKGELIEVLGEFQEQEKSVYLYYQSSRYVQPKIRRFIDFFTRPPIE